MDEFRKGATRVLITTDVWARGLDVQQVRGGGGGGISWGWAAGRARGSERLCRKIYLGSKKQLKTCPTTGRAAGVAGHQLRPAQ